MLVIAAGSVQSKCNANRSNDIARIDTLERENSQAPGHRNEGQKASITVPLVAVDAPSRLPGGGRTRADASGYAGLE